MLQPRQLPALNDDDDDNHSSHMEEEEEDGEDEEQQQSFVNENANAAEIEKRLQMTTTSQLEDQEDDGFNSMSDLIRRKKRRRQRSGRIIGDETNESSMRIQQQNEIKAKLDHRRDQANRRLSDRNMKMLTIRQQQRQTNNYKMATDLVCCLSICLLLFESNYFSAILTQVSCSPQVFRTSSSGDNLSGGASNQQQTTTAANPNSQVNIVNQAPAVPLLSTEFVADEYATLKPDTQASYKCDHGFELIGQETLTCLQSGRWSGSPPNCVTNIALGKPTNQSSTVKGGDSRNANDGRLITQHDSKYCTETRVDQSPWWQIDLLQVYEIRSIRIQGRACCNPQLSLHDIEIRVGNSSTLQGNRLCAWYPNNLEEGVARDFQCAHPILGRFVSIQMVGIESALSLCEVMVFSTREFPAERCNIQSTLAPSAGGANKPPSGSISTTTSATTTQQSTQQQAGPSADNNQLLVFNRTCYEMQTTSGGSFLVADTYCKARGGSLVHSITDLTQSFISQELERMKTKLKSKLVWIGAKRENASPNAQGSITPGSTSALVGGDNLMHNPLRVDRSFSASFNEFPAESLFAADRSIVSPGEPSPIFSPLKLSRTSLMQVSSGAGGATSRGSQTFGLSTAAQQQQHAVNRTIEHPGRSLSIIQPNQVASFFAPPIPISPALPNQPTLTPVAPQQQQPPPSSSPINFGSASSHAHRSLRPPSLVSSSSSSSQSSNGPSSSPSLSSIASNWNSQSALAPATAVSTSSQSSSSSSWRWVGDAPSETLLSSVTSFLWAEDQPNNYNSQQDCIVMDGSKKWLWNDVTCELDYLPWVCQYRPSTCGSPDRNENSTILESPSSASSASQDQDIYQFGKTITYACPVGHRLDGSRTRKCQYDGTWSGRAPKCQYVNCGPIGSQSIENGRVVYLNQSQTTFASQVKYICYEDYVLVGDDTRHCQTDGRWGGKQPFCAYKWCPVLQPISNGALNVSSYSENSIATYQCNSGYKLIGNDTRQCLLGGKWTNQEPFCQYVDCGQPKQIPNGSYQLLNGTNYLSIVEYTCNENYTLAAGSNNKLTCSHNNRWTGREPQCNLIDCGQPQANPGSRYSGDSFAIHSTIDYKCDPGFKEVSGNTQRTCGANGQWTGQPLTCEYVDCKRVPSILKGEVSYINGTTYLASQVSYECTSGNRLSGHRVRFCGPDGRWTGTSPKCEEVRCDAPELPANGSAVYIGNDRSFKEQSFSVGVTVRYECDYGHVVRGSWSSRLCQANGEWSGEPPVCKFVDCGSPPSIEYGNYQLKHPPATGGGGLGSANPAENTRRSDSGSTTGGGQSSSGLFTYYGTIAHYSCDSNFRLQGPAQRECLESGQWRTPMPTCEPVQCPKPEFFDEFTQVALIARSHQQATLDSTSTASSSNANGGLDHQAVLALAAKSTKLIANNQWLIDSASHSYGVGDKLYYSCVPGYELYGGPEIRSCTQYGQWSGSSTPRCRLIDCGRPAPIGQEGRFYLLNETTTFNSIVEYSCVRPFKLVEIKIRQAGNLIETLTNAQAGVIPLLTSLPIGVKVCANNGQWMPNDQQPKCVSGGAGAPIETATTNSNGQFDGIDNTLDGANRNLQVLAGSHNHPTFVHHNGNANHNLDDNLDSSGNNLDATSGYQAGGQHSSHGTSLFAKFVLAISLLVMLALIILTLICIRSGKKPKQVINRASMLTPNGHQAAAAAAAAMQIQLANGKGLQQATNQQQQQAIAQQQQQHAASLMSGQNIYINGMHKIFPGSMVGQSQMSTGGINHNMPMMGSYGDANSVAGLVLTNPGAGRPMIGGGGLDGKAALVETTTTHMGAGLKANGGLVSGGHNAARNLGGHNNLSASSSNIMDTYSRLSIDSDQTNIVGSTHPANKTIRHNPNGLVTFVSPAQQTNRQQQQQQHQVAPTSQHQVSPQSISTSISVSSSSSPSSSSSAHHTTATRLSGTDSASSPSSSNNNQQHNQQNRTNDVHHLQHHHHHQHHRPLHLSGAHHHDDDDDDEQGDYETPQQYINQQPPPLPQSSPPSLPAHPPPPHRVQQHHKQLMKHSLKQANQQQQLNHSSDQVGKQQQQQE